MTKAQKEIKAMSNKELLDQLLAAVERNVSSCVHKGYVTNRMGVFEDNLRKEAYTRFTKCESSN